MYCIVVDSHLQLVFASVNDALYIPAEIEKIQKGETKKEPEKETYLDLFATKNLKLKERVLIPTKQYPRVSFPSQFPPHVCTHLLSGVPKGV